MSDNSMISIKNNNLNNVSNNYIIKQNTDDKTIYKSLNPSMIMDGVSISEEIPLTLSNTSLLNSNTLSQIRDDLSKVDPSVFSRKQIDAFVLLLNMIKVENVSQAEHRKIIVKLYSSLTEYQADDIRTQGDMSMAKGLIGAGVQGIGSGVMGVAGAKSANFQSQALAADTKALSAPFKHAQSVSNLVSRMGDTIGTSVDSLSKSIVGKFEYEKSAQQKVHENETRVVDQTVELVTSETQRNKEFLSSILSLLTDMMNNITQAEDAAAAKV